MITKFTQPLLKHRFGVLLAMQVAMLLAAAFAQNSFFKEEIFLLTLLGVLFGSGFAILRGSRYEWRFLTVGVMALGMNLYGYISPLPEADIAASFANLVFMGWVLMAIAARVFFSRKVDENIILGAACLYIHAGMTFGFVYLLVDYFVPHSFSLATPEVNLGEYSRLLGHFMYYSFVTLGTVGYGDIAPLSAPARYISVIQAMMGQLYLAIMVARLVGLHLTRLDEK